MSSLTACLRTSKCSSVCVDPKECAQDCDVLGQNGGHFQKTIEGCRCGGLTHGSTDRFNNHSERHKASLNDGLMLTLAGEMA